MEIREIKRSKSDSEYEEKSDSFSRSGKWSYEEEIYANYLINLFEEGLLEDCPEGSSLRSYLSKKLSCSPMRISKKYAGKFIGKVRFV